MNLFKRYLLFTTVVFSILLFISCYKENPAYNRENIKGTWICNQYDDRVLDLQDILIYNFDKENNLTISGLIKSTDGDTLWTESNKLSYLVYCCGLDVLGNIKDFFNIPSEYLLQAKYNILSQNDTSVTLEHTQYQINAQDVALEYKTISMDKLPFRYENLDSLNGTWSVNSRNGEAFEDFRIKFNKDLTYDFYTQDVNGDWILSESNEGKFINYKKFIVINSNDNAYLGRVEKKHSSLWNIVEASPYKGSLELNDGKGVSYTFIYLSDKNGDI